ncbi:uncharacterized protein LOC135835456 [Planococcus citri]|uniref:uncharacterized protein LOC135835456 n=1 Tax=Planococcus citri TaxID=170843 RepID=UPI0031F9FB04
MKMFLQFKVTGLVKEICFSFITLLGYLFIGINRSFIAFLFHQLEKPDSEIKINDDQKSWIASFVVLLSPLGCLFSGVVMDVLGRKLYMQMIFVPFVISWCIISFASNIEMLYTGVIVQSVGGGMASAVAAYISEIATADNRGALLSTIEITYSIGIVISNSLMYLLPWKLVALILALFSAVALGLTFLLPESPIWLYSKGQKEKSIQVLESLRCCDQSQIESEIQDMDQACNSSRPKLTIKNTLLGCIRAWKPFLLAFSLFVLMQNTGYTQLIAYAMMIIERLKLPFQSTNIALLYSASGFIASFLTPFTMHHFNRKTALTASAIGMTLSLVCVALYEEFFHDELVKPMAWIVPLALCIHVFSCVLGLLPITFIITGEIFPLDVRGTLNGVYGVAAYIYYAAFFKLFPQFLFNFGVKFLFWTYTAFGLVIVLFGIFLLPETRGITLNEVQRKYFSKSSEKKEQA